MGMGLKDAQKKNLQQLDITDGKGILSCIKKLEANDPVVIVGFGGLGCEALNDLKREIRRRVEKKNKIRIIAVDSDEASLRSLNSLDASEKVTLYEPGVSALATTNTYPLYIQKWKNKNYTPILSGAGCGAIRQNGRFILSYKPTYDKFRAAVRNAIEEVKDGVSAISPLSVIVVAGISGGTGSGTFIDGSYIIHDICEHELHLTEYAVSGYLFLPDAQFGVKGIVEDALLMNGAAALKELDYYLNLEKVNGVYKWPFSEGKERDKRNNIYKFCTLVSGTTTAGMVGGDIKGRAKKVLVENVLSLITAGHMKDANGNEVQVLSSFQDNMISHLNTWFSGKGADTNMYPRSANYCYSVMGFGSAKIPVDAIMSYVAYSMFEQVLSEYKKIGNVTQKDVKDCLNFGITDKDSIISKFKNKIKLNKITTDKKDRPSPNSMKKRDEKFNAYKRKLLSSYQNKYNSLELSLKQISADLKDELSKEMMDRLDTYFKSNNESGGPYYVSKLISSRKMDGGCAGIVESLNELKKELYADQSKDNEKFLTQDLDAMINERASKVDGGLFGLNKESSDKACDDIEDTIYKYFQYSMKIKSYCEEIIQGLIEDVNKQNDKIFSIYTEVFDYVKDILKNNSSLVVNTNMTTNDSQTVYSVDVVNLNEANKDARRLKECLNDYISEEFIDKFKTKFSELISEPNIMKRMTSDDGYFDAYSEIVKSFDAVLDNFYQQAIERFILAYYSETEVSAKDIDELLDTGEDYAERRREILDKAAKNIFDRLRNSAMPLCQVTGGVSLNDFAASKAYITCPDGAVELYNAIKRVVAANGSAGVTVCTKKNASSIDYVTNYACIPIAMIARTKDADIVYTRSINANTKGLHLNEAGEENWTRLPSIFPREMWVKSGDGYVSNVEIAALAKVEEAVNKAFKYGMIIHDDSVGSNAYYTRLIDYDKTINNPLVIERDERIKEIISGSFERGIAAVKSDTPSEEMPLLMPDVVFTKQPIAVNDSWGFTNFADDPEQYNIKLYYRKNYDALLNLEKNFELIDDFLAKAEEQKAKLQEEEAKKAERDKILHGFDEAVSQFVKLVKTRLVYNVTAEDRWKYLEGDVEKMLYYYGLANSFEKIYGNYFVFYTFWKKVDKDTRDLMVKEATELSMNGNVVNDQILSDTKQLLTADLEKKLMSNGDEYCLNRELNIDKINQKAQQYAEKGYFDALSDEISTPYSILRYFYYKLREEL